MKALFLGSDHWVSKRCAEVLSEARVDIPYAIFPERWPSQTLPRTNFLRSQDSLELKTFAPDIILSCFYGHKVIPSLLHSARLGGINLHPSYLPYNRGRHSAFWAIMDGTPMGATIHWMDDGLDTGPIIAQECFSDNGLMNATEVYGRQCRLCVELFERNLPLILSGTAPSISQAPGGSFHRARDIIAATTFSPSDTVTFEYLLKLARATDFGGHGLRVLDTCLRLSVT